MLFDTALSPGNSILLDLTIAESPSLQFTLNQYTKNRLLSFGLIERDKVDDRLEPPDSYRATFFDYTNNRAYLVNGRFGSLDIEVVSSNIQPEPSEEEFEEAVKMLGKDQVLSAALRNGTVATYRPMPPLINGNDPVEKAERTIGVGLAPKDGTQSHEIVGINMIRQTIIRFQERAPKASVALNSVCGPPSSIQQTTPQFTAGSFVVTVKRLVARNNDFTRYLL